MAENKIPRICNITDCPNVSKTRGYCVKHYARWLRYGDATVQKKGMPMQSEIFKRKFWGLVGITDNEDECWLWLRRPNKCGYGVVGIEGASQLAHRVAWAITHGFMTALQVLHTCDTPACCNPNHLWEGTHQENMTDRDAKGRGGDRRGEINGRTILTEADVRQIKHQLADGIPVRQIVPQYPQVSDATIYQIANGVNWTHIQI